MVSVKAVNCGGLSVQPIGRVSRKAMMSSLVVGNGGRMTPRRGTSDGRSGTR